MRKIIIIAGYCDLDTNKNNRFTSICDYLGKDQNDIELITSSFNHTRKTQKELVDTDEYKVTYIYDIGYEKNISIKRIISILLFSYRLNKYLNTLQPDILYCAAPPISVSQVALRFCKRHGIPMILDVQDLWPEAFEMVTNNKLLIPIYKLLYRMIDNVYANATEVFAVSETYANRIESVRHCGNVKTVYLGVNMKRYEDALDRFHGRKNTRLKIVYIGTLGHSYDIPTMLYALENLFRDGYSVDVIIVGDGPKMNEFIDLKSQLRLTAVEFVGRKPYGEMVEIIKDCDIAINPISKGSAGSVINKVCDYAAACLPVVNSQENKEYRNLLLKYDAGINVECGNSDSMCKGIQELIDDDDRRRRLSINARRMAEELFDRKKTYRELVKALENL